MRNCELEGHCECWYDGDDCCDCGETSDDYFDLDEDDDLLPQNNYWDYDDGSDETIDDD